VVFWHPQPIMLHNSLSMQMKIIPLFHHL